MGYAKVILPVLTRTLSPVMRHLRSNRRSSVEGFTLVEVIISMVLISVMCLSVFVGLNQMTKNAMAVALRNEAYHLMQAEAERLLQGDYFAFDVVPAATIQSSVKTTYAPSALAKFALGADNAAGRVTFTRRVVSLASTASSKTLQVEVEWTWQGRPNAIATPLYRTQ